MPPNKQRGSKVIYVAGSARDFPEEVQDWLRQAGNRAAASPNIYDLLATLALGARPQAIIISIDAVDYSELEFFDHVARLSRPTRIYVAGADHHQDKIDAALARGAILFDQGLLNEDLSAAAAPAPNTGPAGLVAGSVRPASALAPADDEPVVRFETAGETPERPPVRLVRDEDTEEEEPPRAPVPWAPAADRPQRTPPKPRSPGVQEVLDRSADEAAPVEMPTRTPPAESGKAEPRPARFAPVDLTPEELAALIGKPISSEPPAREQQA